ncbi:MAG: hypothetical protein L6R45_02750 [Anaerolineae bacterium]|nr:hypothetical protein [Anaerolineae bacterium]
MKFNDQMLKKSSPAPQNLVPLPYRQVSVQPYTGPMTAEAIGMHLLGRDSYRRTRYVVLEQDNTCAIAVVSRESEEPLFSPITAVEVLALPPLQLVLHNFDLRDLADQTPDAEAYLIPCRAAGLNFDAPTYFLDEHPPRHNWTMIACERSRQIHRHFYGDDAPRIEMCPRRLTQDDGTPTLLKCCLLEEGFEIEGCRVIVPWGATLAQVEGGLKALVSTSEVEID